MVLSRRFSTVSRTTRSRLLLLTFAATTSLCTLDRAAADCMLTSGPGTAGEPEDGARITCQAAGGAEDTSVTAAADSSDIQVTIENGASFTSDAAYVTIRNDSQITNAATLNASPIDGSPIFSIEGSNNTVINSGTLSNTSGLGILVDGGSGNTIRNDGFIRADSTSYPGIRIRNSPNATIINNGEITSRAVTPGGYGIIIESGPGQSSLIVNRNLIESQRGLGFFSGSGTERLENYGVIRSAPGFAAANLGIGEDTYVVGGTSSFNTFIDGGADTDTLAFGMDAGSLDVSQIESTTGGYRNFERLAKIGSADWTLTGTNNAALPITVDEGRLFVDATMPNAPLNVRSGGTLGGAGTAGAVSVSSGATLAPGGRTNIGTLTVGSATFDAGSRYLVRVDGQGGSDRLQVNGVATINGGTVSVDVSQGYVLNTRYRILTATSLVGQRFQSAVASLALLQPVLSYDTTNAYVTFERATQPPDNPTEPDDPEDPTNPDNPTDPGDPITLDQIGRTWNQISTGRALEAQGIAGPLLPIVLSQPTIPDALRALDLLSGEAYATAVGLAAGDTQTIHRMLLNRLRTIGPTGVAAAPGSAWLAYAPGLSAGKAPFPAAPRSPALQADLWGQGFGSWGSRDGRSGLGLASADQTTGGFILGAETTFDAIWRIGMAGAYSHTRFDLSDRLSSGGIDSYHAALYGSGAVSGFSFRGGATYTRHEIDISRSAVMSGFSGDANGSLSLDSAGLYAEIGYPLQFGRLVAEPVANLSYVHTGSGSFAEDGGVMALRGAVNDLDTAWTTLGLRFSGALTDDGALKGYSLIGWRHAFGNRLPTTLNQLGIGGDPFLIVGTPIDRDSAVVETGLDWSVAAATILGIRYNGQLGAHDRSQSVLGHFATRF